MDTQPPYSQGDTPSQYPPGAPMQYPPQPNPYAPQGSGWQTLPPGYTPQVPPSYPPTPPGYQTMPSGPYAPPPPGYTPPPPGYAPASRPIYPPPPYAPPPGYVSPYTGAQQWGQMQQRPSGAPVAVEAILALFGFYGIGWLMAGNTTTGVLLLIGGWVWDAIAIGGTVLTFGFGGCIFGPLHIAFVAVSSVMLSNYLKSGRASLS